MNKNLVKRVLVGTALLYAAAVPFLALAQGIPPAPPTSNIPTTPRQIQTSLENIVGWMFTFFWIVAVGYIIWAAFTFLSAGGDAEKVQKAKTRILYALIAAAVVLLANGVKAVVESLLGGK